jgi:hypothetical protein
MKASWRKAFDSWDGRQMQALADCYAAEDDPRELIQECVRIVEREPGLAGPATWTLKHHLEAGGQLDSDKISRLFASADHLDDWPEQLHLLQMLPVLDLHRDWLNQLEPFVQRCLESRVKFVRAWAVQGERVPKTSPHALRMKK